MSNPQIKSLILVGGQSSRMGQDKALLQWHGQTILAQICQIAIACTQQTFLITPWPERYLPICPPQAQFITETSPGQGPLTAIIQGLTEITTKWLLVLACDLPMLKLDILQQWINQLEELPLTTLAAIPYHHSRWEPLCGFYRHEALTSLQTFQKTQQKSLQIWLNQVEVKPLAVDLSIELMLLNCNTPDDYHHLYNS